MFGIGTQELLIILLVVLVLFGGKRIPDLARSLGHGMRDFRKALNDVRREVDLDALSLPPPERAERPASQPRPGSEPAAPPEARRSPAEREGGEGI